MECLELWTQLQESEEVIKALNNLSWSEWRLGSFNSAIHYAQKALQLALEQQDRLGQAKALNNLSWVHLYQGKLSDAANLQRQTLELHTQMNNARAIAFAKVNLAWIILRQDQLQEANLLLREAFPVFTKLKDQQMLAFTYLVQTDWYYQKQDYSSALAVLDEQCLPVFEHIGDSWAIANSYLKKGQIYCIEKAFQTARTSIQKAMTIFQQTHDLYGEANALLWQGKLHSAERRNDEAQKAFNRSQELAHAMQAQLLLADLQSQLKQSSNKVSKAEEPIHEKLQISGEDPFFMQARQLILEHLSNPNFGVQDLCRELHISHSHLHRKLQQRCGQSANQLIRSIRLEKAKELLVDPQLSITTIAYEAGFRDPDYFHRLFKREEGMTPGEFRRQLEK